MYALTRHLDHFLDFTAALVADLFRAFQMLHQTVHGTPSDFEFLLTVGRDVLLAGCGQVRRELVRLEQEMSVHKQLGFALGRHGIVCGYSKLILLLACDEATDGSSYCRRAPFTAPRSAC